ncbi:MAG: DUF2070 family protein [Candidatus Micrarchaeota archaeon]|nr:DUF2070 family protein [Candidatus Micrarchaeota archaeon]
MRSNKEDGVLKYTGIFYKRLPGSIVLLALVLLLSVGVGIAAVALLHNPQGGIPSELPYILVNGSLTGLMLIMMPTVLTVLFVKMLRRYVAVKYILLIAMMGALAYAVYILIGSEIYHVGGTSLATVVVLVGDASIFGWWFFISKVILGKRKQAILFAVVQPTLNVLFYIPASVFVFSLRTPLQLLLIKLYAALFIFMIVSYSLVYIFDSPIKRNLGFGGIDAFSQMLQSWLFDINVSKPFAPSFGTPTDIEAHTLVARRRDGTPKAVFFMPEIHFGPAGSIGGSNFPYLLERYISTRYKATPFILHCPVNEDNNPVSSTQISKLYAALDSGIRDAKPSGSGISYRSIRNGTSTLANMRFGNVSMVTLTRAPNVTEDLDPDVGIMFKKLLNDKLGKAILVDAHNSRLESASAEELAGVKFDSKVMNEYMGAIGMMGGGRGHSSKRVMLGTASIDLYSRLGPLSDIGPGSVNVAIFMFNSSKRAIIEFNSNNMLPSVRNAIVSRLKKVYGIDAELYTTDTHCINSLGRDVSNVLGRSTSTAKLLGIVEEAVGNALKNAEEVRIAYSWQTMKNFVVWGKNVKEKLFSVVSSVLAIAKFLVPTIIAMGFVIASWIVSLI